MRDSPTVLEIVYSIRYTNPLIRGKLNTVEIVSFVQLFAQPKRQNIRLPKNQIEQKHSIILKNILNFPNSSRNNRLRRLHSNLGKT